MYHHFVYIVLFLFLSLSLSLSRTCHILESWREAAEGVAAAGVAAAALVAGKGWRKVSVSHEYVDNNLRGKSLSLSLSLSLFFFRISFILCFPSMRYLCCCPGNGACRNTASDASRRSIAARPVKSRWGRGEDRGNVPPVRFPLV